MSSLVKNVPLTETFKVVFKVTYFWNEQKYKNKGALSSFG
jgi:hypothetical protein